MKFRIWAVALVALFFVLGGARPASAHNAGGVVASNFKSTLTSVTPAIPGVTVSLEELGERVQVINNTDLDLVVLGYSSEPYLRVSNKGVYENQKSPAHFTNQTFNGTGFVPPTASASAPPEWHKLSSDDLVTWHDHRAHWLSNTPPALVREAPNNPHVIIPEFTIPMRYGDQAIEAKGNLAWVPGPTPWPWYGAALLTLAAALAIAAFTRSLKVVAAAVAVLIAIDVVHTLGLALFVAGSWTSRLERAAGSMTPSVIAWAVGIYGVRRMQKGTDDGPWYCVFTVCLIGALGGFSDATSLNHSQVPFVWAPNVDRAAVAVSMGLASGLFVALMLLLYRQRKSIARVTA